MYHILIHSSVGGNLGCFHVLAVVGGAAMNTGVHVSFWIMFSLEVKELSLKYWSFNDIEFCIKESYSIYSPIIVWTK